MSRAAVRERPARERRGRAEAGPPRSSHAPRSHHLDTRGAGNQAIRRLIQTQLGAGDKGRDFEHEADSIAERVSAPGPRGQCACGRPIEGNGLCAECARRSGGPRASVLPVGGLPLSVERALRRQGRPLDTAAQGPLEQAVDANLGAVRIHTGADAAEAARALHARAFTAGSHVVFGAGEYSPDTPWGRKLLAHEIAHVVQQELAPAVIQRAPDTTTPPPAAADVGPCEVDVPSLTNQGLVQQLQRARNFLQNHEKGDDYYDHANLMRRAVDERNKRARQGHVWLLTDPPAIPSVLYELQPGGMLQVDVVPADVAAELGPPTTRPSTSVITPSQLDRFLDRENIPRVDAATYFGQQDPKNITPLSFLLKPPPPQKEPLGFMPWPFNPLAYPGGSFSTFTSTPYGQAPGGFFSPFWSTALGSTSGVVGGPAVPGAVRHRLSTERDRPGVLSERQPDETTLRLRSASRMAWRSARDLCRLVDADQSSHVSGPEPSPGQLQGLRLAPAAHPET
jgi:uncharacterized protein DUF4157